MSKENESILTTGTHHGFEVGDRFRTNNNDGRTWIVTTIYGDTITFRRRHWWELVWVRRAGLAISLSALAGWVTFLLGWWP